MSNQQALQLCVFVVVLAALCATVVFMRRKPEQWAYAIPPLSWMLHVQVFYGLVFGRDFGWYVVPGLDFTLWSAIIRLQAAFLILGVMAMLAYERLIFRTS